MQMNFLMITVFISYCSISISDKEYSEALEQQISAREHHKQVSFIGYKIVYNLIPFAKLNLPA